MSTPNEAHTKQYTCINGSRDDILDRFVVSELCKGWPGFRDNSEWMNYRSLFTDDAYVWTTWSGARTIDDFISISKKGKANGAAIQHRENGTTVELNPGKARAVGKMKATITQRFIKRGATAADPDIEYDVDCDCRFLFFCLHSGDDNKEWKVKYVKLVYEKDKVCPVNGKTVPDFDRKELDKYPKGYQYLGVAQASLGYEVDAHLVTLGEEFWGKMYHCMEAWLDGKDDPGLFWDKDGKQMNTPA